MGKGAWKGQASPIVSPDYVHEMTTPQTKYGPYENYANPCYGLLTWNNADTKEFPGTCWLPGKGPGKPTPKPKETEVFPAGAPHELFFADGTFGQVILVNPSQNTVVVTMGIDAGVRALDIGIELYKGMCDVSRNCS